MIKLIKNTFYKEKKTKALLCKFIKNAEQLSMGVKCKEFENSFAKYQGRKYAVLFNSGSSANLALIQSLLNLNILNKGDNVGFSALTWATNVMPLIQLGLNPIPIDVSLEHLNITYDNVLKLKELKLIFVTNLLGFCGDLDKIKEFCDKKNIFLIEDNCENLGSVYKKKKLGNFGLASTFSTYVGHHLSTIEGGFVCTDNKELYDMLLMVRAHGWSRNLDNATKDNLYLANLSKISDKFYLPYTFYNLAYNLRPTEITGFIGLEQLKYADKIINKRNKNFKLYTKATKDNLDLQKLDVSHMDLVSNFAFPLVFKNRELWERYKKYFTDKVEIRPIVGGSILKQPFFEGYGGNCPNAEKIHELGFYIPNNPELTQNELNEICNILKNGNKI